MKIKMKTSVWENKEKERKILETFSYMLIAVAGINTLATKSKIIAILNIFVIIIGILAIKSNQKWRDEEKCKVEKKNVNTQIEKENQQKNK